MILKVFKLHENCGYIWHPQHFGDAGMDIEVPASFFGQAIPAGKKMRIPLGLAFVPEDGHYIRFEPRSSRFDAGLIIHGIIDWSYRGELALIVWNISDEDYVIKEYDRLGQAIFALALTPSVEYYDGYPTEETTRGRAGFGSTDRTNQ